VHATARRLGRIGLCTAIIIASMVTIAGTSPAFATTYDPDGTAHISQPFDSKPGEEQCVNTVSLGPKAGVGIQATGTVECQKAIGTLYMLQFWVDSSPRNTKLGDCRHSLRCSVTASTPNKDVNLGPSQYCVIAAPTVIGRLAGDEAGAAEQTIKSDAGTVKLCINYPVWKEAD
jgi:hypothetical protein